MARKFSLAYLTIPGVDPVEQIKIAKERKTSAAVIRHPRRSRASVLFIVKVPECLSWLDW